jgi:hypothetical protein
LGVTMKFAAFNPWKTIPRKTNLPQAFWSPRSTRRITAAVMALGLCAVGCASAAGVDGQLWYTAQQFLTTNSTNDNKVGSIFSDGSGQRRVLVSADTSKYFTSVGLDRAAGFFFAINTDFNGDATLVVGNISTGAVIQTLSINPNDYGIEALAVNPVNHEVYIGIFGDSTTDTGIVQIPYNAVTGAVPTNIFTGSVISPSFYLTTEARGSPETFATSFSLDVADQKLYFTDEDIDLENENGDPWGPPWNSTNGIYVIDLNATTPIATQLTTAGQFPATNAGYHTAPYGDGTQSTPLLPGAAPTVLNTLLQPLAAGQTLTLAVPPTWGSRPVDTLLRASALDGSGFRVERLNIGTAPRVRLVSVDSDGSERPTDWIQTSLSAPLGVEVGENAAQVVLLTAKAELSVTLTGKTKQPVYQVQSVGEVTQLH